MELKTVIENRRSIRKFTTEGVSDADIAAMLDAAILAPSGGNRQPWHFYVVQNENLLEQLRQRSYTTEWFKAAPLVICVAAIPSVSEKGYGERGRDLYSIQDTAAAIENILLTAHDLGLGGCWCGAFAEEAAAEILSLPDGTRPIALLALGHPADEPACPRKRPVNSVATYLK